MQDLRHGDLAVECPACPHPGRNMPEGGYTGDRKRYVSYELFCLLCILIFCKAVRHAAIASRCQFQVEGEGKRSEGYGIAYGVRIFCRRREVQSIFRIGFGFERGTTLFPFSSLHAHPIADKQLPVVLHGHAIVPHSAQ